MTLQGRHSACPDRHGATPSAERHRILQFFGLLFLFIVVAGSTKLMAGETVKHDTSDLSKRQFQPGAFLESSDGVCKHGCAEDPANPSNIATQQRASPSSPLDEVPDGSQDLVPQAESGTGEMVATTQQQPSASKDLESVSQSAGSTQAQATPSIGEIAETQQQSSSGDLRGEVTTAMGSITGSSAFSTLATVPTQQMSDTGESEDLVENLTTVTRGFLSSAGRSGVSTAAADPAQAPSSDEAMSTLRANTLNSAAPLVSQQQPPSDVSANGSPTVMLSTVDEIPSSRSVPAEAVQQSVSSDGLLGQIASTLRTIPVSNSVIASTIQQADSSSRVLSQIISTLAAIPASLTATYVATVPPVPSVTQASSTGLLGGSTANSVQSSGTYTDSAMNQLDDPQCVVTQIADGGTSEVSVPCNFGGSGSIAPANGEPVMPVQSTVATTTAELSQAAESPVSPASLVASTPTGSQIASSRPTSAAASPGGDGTSQSSGIGVQGQAGPNSQLPSPENASYGQGTEGQSSDSGSQTNGFSQETSGQVSGSGNQSSGSSQGTGPDSGSLVQTQGQESSQDNIPSPPSEEGQTQDQVFSQSNGPSSQNPVGQNSGWSAPGSEQASGNGSSASSSTSIGTIPVQAGCPVVAHPTCPLCSSGDGSDGYLSDPSLGPCPGRGYRCAQCIDGWFCPPQETPAQTAPCGFGWPCYHCSSGWFCQVDSEPTQNPAPEPTQQSVPVPVPESAPASPTGSTNGSPSPGGDSMGGGSGISNPSSSGSDSNSLDPNWTSLGCFQDGISRTLLGGKPKDYVRGDVSAGACISHCNAEGYSFAGTENGQECWCGRGIRDDAVRLPQTYCETACQGARGDFCGGSWTISVFFRDGGGSGSSNSGQPPLTPYGPASRLMARGSRTEDLGIGRMRQGKRRDLTSAEFNA